MNSIARWMIVLFGAGMTAFPAKTNADHLILFGLGQHYFQGQPFGPVLAGEDRFVFTAAALPDAGVSTPMLSVSITSPDGPERGLVASEPGEPLFFERTFEALADLEEGYPPGLYVIRVWTAPVVSCAVPIERNGAMFPPPPRIANLEAAQSIVAESGFTLHWDSWEQGTITDFAQLTVRDDEGDTVFESPFLMEHNALNGLSTSFEIPAGALVAGQRYTGELFWLTFAREATGECANVVAQEGYYTTTEFPLTTTGIGAAFRPSLRSSIPANDESAVPTRSVIAFHFSELMAPEVDLTWSPNAEGLGWSYRWDDSATTLYAIASEPLPGEATVRWSLNASTQAPGFQDLTGLRLWPIQGRFSTAASAAPTPDVHEIILVRGEDYGQRTDLPQPLGYHFGLAQVELNALNTVIEGRLELPNGRGVLLALTEDGTLCEAFAEYAFAEDLERFLPDGQYTLTLETAHDGLRTFSLPLSGARMPAAPRLLDLATMQSIEITQPFQIRWAPFADGGDDDIVLVEILHDQGDTVLETGSDGVPHLSGTATSFGILAHTLYPGRQYEGVIRFLKALDTDTTSYPGAETFSLAASSTRFMMRTAGEPIRPVLRVLPAPPGAFRVQVTGEPGRAYVLEMATGLEPNAPNMGFGYWYQAVAVDGVFELTEYDILPWSAHRFYRVREEP